MIKYTEPKFELTRDETTGIFVPAGNHIGKEIYIGSDHRGYDVKQIIKGYLDEIKLKYTDVGCKNIQRCDYPDFAAKVAFNVGEDRDHKTIGILVCGSGNGMAIVANKIEGAFAVSCRTINDIVNAREHNNMNVLCLGADNLDQADLTAMIYNFLVTDFPMNGDPAYLRRCAKTRDIDRKYRR